MFIIDNGIKREVKSLYPNIAAYIAYSPMSFCTFWNHMDISEEILNEMLYNNEPLTLGERYGFYKLTGMNFNAMKCRKMIYLNPDRPKHISMVKTLEGKMKTILKYAAEGDDIAIKEVNRYGETVDVRFADLFDNFILGKATYSEYLVRARELDFSLMCIENGREKRENRIRSKSIKEPVDMQNDKKENP